MYMQVLYICFALCTVNYGLMAIFGYMMYGQSLKSQVTLNLPSGKISSKIAIYTTLINPLTKYALLVTPIAEAFEDWFQVSKVRCFSFLVRTILVISTVVVALAVPFFAYIVALTGSFLSSTATMLLPCLCYIKIFKSSKRLGIELAICVVIIGIGLMVATVGTYSSLKQIIQSL